jgi:crotonobetainyl-CoA:carnitine CoA-transferase CaiB-like acyl-CoA transferase
MIATYPGESRPHLVNSNVSDPVSGFIGVGFALAAIDRARLTGRGAYLDLSELDAMMCLIGDLFVGPVTNDDSARRLVVMPALGDDQWVVVDLSTVGAAALREAGLATSPGEDPEKSLMAEVAKLPKSEAMFRFQSAGIAICAVNSAGEVAYDSHLREREFWTPVSHEVLGAYPAAGPWAKFSETPGAIRTGAPLLGEHNEEILTELGIEEARKRELQRDGVVTNELPQGLRVGKANLRVWAEVGAISAPQSGARLSMVADIQAGQARRGAEPGRRQGGQGLDSA